MLAELALGVQAAASVIQVDMLAGVQARVLRGAQIVDQLCIAIGGVSVQKRVEVGSGIRHGGSCVYLTIDKGKSNEK